MVIPSVSVLMGVYNGERYLAQAIDSILGQSFTDFEFIIINDGSTDGTGEILHSYSDPRIRVVEQSNVGLTRSLNRGISLARGEYIARMDDDDVSMPERLAKQVGFLDAYPEVGVLGTACLIRDMIKGTEWVPPVLTSNEEIRHNLIKGNPLIHASVMMRRSLLETLGGYDESYLFAQDYALWMRLAPHTIMRNLPEALIVHREHWSTVSMARVANWRTFVHTVWVRMRLRYNVFRSLDYPFYYVLYALQPIPFALSELKHKVIKR